MGPKFTSHTTNTLIENDCKELETFLHAINANLDQQIIELNVGILYLDSHGPFNEGKIRRMDMLRKIEIDWKRE